MRIHANKPLTLFARVHTLPVVPMQTDLKTARDRRKWDQKTLARRSGVNQSTISRLESGEVTNPSLDTVEKLELALRLRRGSLSFSTHTEAKAS